MPIPVRQYDARSAEQIRSDALALHRRLHTVAANKPFGGIKAVVRTRDYDAHVALWLEQPEAVPRPTEFEIAAARRNGAAFSPRYLVRLVVFLTKTPEDKLTCQRQFADVVKPRHIAMYVIRRFGNLSSPRTAALLGLRDHTTTLWGVRRAEHAIRELGLVVADENDPAQWIAALWSSKWPRFGRRRGVSS